VCIRFLTNSLCTLVAHSDNLLNQLLYFFPSLFLTSQSLAVFPEAPALGLSFQDTKSMCQSLVIELVQEAEGFYESM
jgi:hypothetical protein